MLGYEGREFKVEREKEGGRKKRSVGALRTGRAEKGKQVRNKHMQRAPKNLGCAQMRICHDRHGSQNTDVDLVHTGHRNGDVSREGIRAISWSEASVFNFEKKKGRCHGERKRR